MGKINAVDLAADFESCIGKAPYPSSGSGSESLTAIQNGAAVDCSGIFVAAFKKYGESIYHGSNTIWRKYLSEYGTITDNTSTNGYKRIRADENPLKSTQLEVGMAVFKWNTLTPSKFNDGQGDYQHIGLVTSVHPLRIVHSTSQNKAGVVVQTKIGTFCAWGKLKDVEYETSNFAEVAHTQEEETIMTGGKLKTNANMRIRANSTVTSKVLGTVPSGTILNFTGDFDSGWVAVTYNGASGYLCTTKEAYATLVSATAQTTNDDLESRVAALEQAVAELKAMIDDLG